MLNIHVQRALRYTADGWAVETDTYIQLQRCLLESGLLAQLSGTQLKLLIALGLQATILTVGDFFEHLRRLGLVTEADLETVICYQSQEQLASLTGIHRETVAENLVVLERDFGLVTYRTSAQRRSDGRFHQGVVIIHADFLSAPHAGKSDTVSHHVGKSDTGKSPDRVLATPKSGSYPTYRAGKSDTVPHLVGSTVSVDPTEGVVAVDVVVDNARQQQQTNTADDRVGKPDTESARILAAFAEALGAPYHAGDRDYVQVRELRQAGYTTEQIIQVLRDTVAQALMRGTRPRSFGYCVKAIRAYPPNLTPLAAPVISPLSLPEEMLADLTELGWSGAVDEVLTHYVANPDRVLDWLAYWLAYDGTRVRSRAALFRQSLRSGAPAPLAEQDEQDAGAGVRYISGVYADFIQH